MKYNFVKRIIAGKTARLMLGGILLLIIGTFVAWRISIIISPTSSQTGNGATITWTVSDHYLVNTTKVPLPNLLGDTTIPSYEEFNAATPLTVSNGNVQLPRFQGTIDYN